MSNLVVLPLEEYMREQTSWVGQIQREEIREFHKPHAIVYGKPNIYYRRHTKECWFETPDGEAYEYDPKCVIHASRMGDVERLNHRQVSALKAMVDQKMATAEQRQLYYDAHHLMELRNLVRDTRKFLLTI